jgi:ADP-ribosylglycohydrolase
LTGGILGAGLGEEAIPADLLEGLRDRWIVEQIADDLHGFEAGETGDTERYPGW